MKPHRKSRLIGLLSDPEYRHAFFSGMISTSIASQIKANRLDRGWSQEDLADRAGMKQSRISAMEDISYERWTIRTLKRLAQAFDVTLSVRFETFGKAFDGFEAFKDNLVVQPFAKDFSLGSEPERVGKVLQYPSAEAFGGRETKSGTGPSDQWILPYSKELTEQFSVKTRVTA